LLDHLFFNKVILILTQKSKAIMTTSPTTLPTRTIRATRYVTPLREGGSLPAIVEADDDGLYVLKFRGAGQGTKALIAELVVGELARAAGLPVPEIVLVDLDPDLARTEPDPEIQDLIRSSAGVNLALDYLPGSVTFDPIVEKPDATLASEIVWLDAFVMNVDRTARNTNMLMWHRKLYLIDHGAALYLHHAAEGWSARGDDRFALIKDHVLLQHASGLDEADEAMTARITPEIIEGIVRAIPADWLAGADAAAETAARNEYLEFFRRRIASPHYFLEEARNARSMHI
jgi:hypothetical protein